MIEPNTDGRGETAPPAASRPWRLLSEMELLISGAVIFSLFRLPAPLQRLFFRPLSKSQLAELTDPAARRQKVERRTSYIPFWR